MSRKRMNRYGTSYLLSPLGINAFVYSFATVLQKLIWVILLSALNVRFLAFFPEFLALSSGDSKSGARWFVFLGISRISSTSGVKTKPWCSLPKKAPILGYPPLLLAILLLLFPSLPSYFKNIPSFLLTVSSFWVVVRVRTENVWEIFALIQPGGPSSQLLILLFYCG